MFRRDTVFGGKRIGLNVVKSIIEQRCGRIRQQSVKSEGGQGGSSCRRGVSFDWGGLNWEPQESRKGRERKIIGQKQLGYESTGAIPSAGKLLITDN